MSGKSTGTQRAERFVPRSDRQRTTRMTRSADLGCGALAALLAIAGAFAVGGWQAGLVALAIIGVLVGKRLWLR